jgi:hypothetical protein
VNFQSAVGSEQRTGRPAKNNPCSVAASTTY